MLHVMDTRNHHPVHSVTVVSKRPYLSVARRIATILPDSATEEPISLLSQIRLLTKKAVNIRTHDDGVKTCVPKITVRISNLSPGFYNLGLTLNNRASFDKS